MLIYGGSDKGGYPLNQVMEVMQNHRSCRNYTDRPVLAHDLDQIIRTAQWAPSFIHGQHVTVISVTDQLSKTQLAKLCGNQAHIVQAPVFLVFCADFYRVHRVAERARETIVVTDDVDSLLIGATDVGLAMSNAITAAESLGLGTVPIGGIRRNSLDVIACLKLPKYVIPVSGLCLGYPGEEPGQKPRMPQSIIHHRETYNTNLDHQLDEYDRVMSEYTAERTGGELRTNWTDRIVNYYKSYKRGTAAMLKQQGFLFKD